MSNQKGNAKTPEEIMLEVLNSSGFPFQVALKREIEKTYESKQHNWLVEAEEYNWKHPYMQRTGFIDLVLRRDFVHILIEAKRRKADGQWVFLTPKGSQDFVGRLTPLCTCKQYRTLPQSNPLGDVFGWWEWDGFMPPSRESAYCAFRKQDEKSALLEAIADDLLPATEALGVHEMQLKAPSGRSDWSLFLPMIVTNIDLYTAEFDPENIDLSTGQIELDHCTFNKVECVRFRKSLSTYFPNDYVPRGNTRVLRDAHLATERTILVVNAPSLINVLQHLGVDLPAYSTFTPSIYEFAFRMISKPR